MLLCIFFVVVFFVFFFFFFFFFFSLKKLVFSSKRRSLSLSLRVVLLCVFCVLFLSDETRTDVMCTLKR